ncbi:MAG: ATP phosphoribosyltransferase, partial [Patescibacteria group bacterium]|nr:ATP phosphoribosyltransferase [Patescibacteria group bacterium]
GGWRKDVAQFLSALLVGTLEVRDQMYLLLNAPTADLEEILAVLPSLKSPTVQPLADQGFCSVSAIVPSTQVNTIIRRLQKLGASGFVTLPPSTVM